MTARSRRDRFARTHTSLELDVPRWVHALALRAGARRDPLEIARDQVLTPRPGGQRFDYWAETETPKAGGA